MESAEPTTTEIVKMVRDRYIENGHSIADIQNGRCFEFADDVVRQAEELGNHHIKTFALGNFFKYSGEWDDEPTGFDVKLLRTHWVQWKPVRGLTWREMFQYGFNWDGAHGWVTDMQTLMCYDAVNVEGVASPFDLDFFKPYRDEALAQKAINRASRQ